MGFPRWEHWSGPAAALGGAQWVAGAVLTATRPEGCVAAECDLPGRSMRVGTTLDAVLFPAAVLLIAAGGAGLVHRARAAGRFGRWGRVGLVVAGVGVAQVVVASLVQTLVYAGNFPLMPWLVIPSGLAVVLGLLLAGTAILRAGVLPPWAAGLLIAGVLALLGVNDQDARVLLAVPFGIAWIAVGWTLWSGTDENGELAIAVDGPLASPPT